MSELIDIRIIRILGKEHPKIPYKWEIETDSKISYLVCWDENYSENLFQVNQECQVPISGYNERYNNYTLNAALHMQENNSPLKVWYKDKILPKIDEIGHNYITLEGEFRASQIPYCARKQILGKYPDWIDLDIIPVSLEEIPERELLTLGTNNSGQAIHEFIQNIVDDPLINIETPVEKEYTKKYKDEVVQFKILGHIDLEIPLNGDIHVVDIKTFNEKCDYDAYSFLPNPKHKEQLSIYQDIQQKDGDLLYFNRNDLEPLFFQQSYKDSQKIFTNVLIKVCMMRYSEIKKTLPEILPKKWSNKTETLELNYECNFCEFQNFCHGDEN